MSSWSVPARAAGTEPPESLRRAGPDGLSPHSSVFKLEEDDAPIKRCPKCKVYIERDEGCAQMMCKSCRHAFCWYCLESLDVSAAAARRPRPPPPAPAPPASVSPVPVRRCRLGAAADPPREGSSGPQSP